ncbi:hypothetical protein Tco_0168806 [Tanacetum coccineum]
MVLKLVSSSNAYAKASASLKSRKYFHQTEVSVGDERKMEGASHIMGLRIDHHIPKSLALLATKEGSLIGFVCLGFVHERWRRLGCLWLLGAPYPVVTLTFLFLSHRLVDRKVHRKETHYELSLPWLRSLGFGNGIARWVGGRMVVTWDGGWFSWRGSQRETKRKGSGWGGADRAAAAAMGRGGGGGRGGRGLGMGRF